MHYKRALVRSLEKHVKRKEGTEIQRSKGKGNNRRRRLSTSELDDFAEAVLAVLGVFLVHCVFAFAEE